TTTRTRTEKFVSLRPRIPDRRPSTSSGIEMFGFAANAIPHIVFCRGQQLFAVFGEPDARLHRSGADFTVELLGMDVYDPATGEVSSSGTDGVAAWFLDTDYDRRSFLISQASFPGSAATDPWARLGRALRGWVDPDAFEMLRGTTSLPFSPGKEGRVAIKVIDFRGNEAIKILDLPNG
ncbi:MAG: hypothetical protein ACT4OQ_07435, partial [Chloroflexota bacterium]